MIPLRDEYSSHTTPHITRILIIINIIVFSMALLPDFSKQFLLAELFGVLPLQMLYTTSLYRVSLRYGMIPTDVLQGQRLYTLFTSMFLHANLIHLGLNMLHLYVFGDNVEDTLGHMGYALFYFVAGIIASFVYLGSLLFFNDVEGLTAATIGASGAISAVLGAYFVLYPRARILTLVFLGWVWIVPIPAVALLGYWFALQFLNGVLAPLAGGVAFWAHIGGFIAGLFFGAAERGKRHKRDF